MTDVEFQRMRANIYRDEVLDSHGVIDRLQKESETYRVHINEQNTCLENLQDENRKLKVAVQFWKRQYEETVDLRCRDQLKALFG